MFQAKNILQFKNFLNNNAELGWQEFQTTQYIQENLKAKPVKIGFQNKKVGLLYKIGTGKKSILIRADIDALKTEKGVRHICGHSSNMSSLMGAFLNTQSKVEELTKADKSIYFLFQPAEETYPSGAEAFVRECKEILPEIKYAFATHAKPLMPLDQIGLKKGVLWARGDYMEIEIFGHMVHIKNALKGKDSLEAASHLILYIKSLQARFSKILRINIGVIKGGLQPNTVADYAILKGDVRLIKDKYQNMVRTRLSEKITKIEKELEVKIKLHYFSGYPALQNDQALTRKIISFLNKRNKSKIISDNSLFSFGCEDFSFIAEKIPSTYALIGTGDRFDVHEENCTISDKGTLKIYEYFCNIIDWWLS